MTRWLALALFASTLLACERPATSEASATPPASPAAPEPDPDGDTILAEADACPDEPGLPPDGCPLRDSDGDGVLDPDDQCPDTLECINGFDDADGCPDTLPEDLAGVIGVITELNFVPDKSDIKAASFPHLDHIAEVLARYPDLNIEISGHVDSSLDGVVLRRRQPSRRRAEAVRDYLVHAGIEPQRMIAKGYGPDVPIASNETAEGRAQNRRVELRVLEPPWGEGASCEGRP